METRISLRDLAIIIFVMALWGSSYTAAKLGLAEYPPFLMIGLRFAMAALILLPFARIPEGKLPQLFAISLTYGTIHFALLTLSLKILDSTTVLILTRLQVPFAAILAAMFLHDRIGWRKIGGMIVAFIGVIVVVGEPRFSGSMTGILAIFMCMTASLAWAFSNILIKKLGPVNNTSLNAVIHLLAAPQFVVLSLLFEHGQADAIMNAGWRGLLLIAYLAIVIGVAAETLWYVMLRKYKVNVVMPFTLTVPLFGIAISAMVLGEAITMNVIVGGVMVLSGIAVIIFRLPHVGTHGGFSIPHLPHFHLRLGRAAVTLPELPPQ